MGTSARLNLLGNALNGPDMMNIKDACLRLCLTELQKAGRSITQHRQTLKLDAIKAFRRWLRHAEASAHDELSWRDRRMLSRVLASARALNNCLPA